MLGAEWNDIPDGFFYKSRYAIFDPDGYQRVEKILAEICDYMAQDDSTYIDKSKLLQN